MFTDNFKFIIFSATDNFWQLHFELYIHWQLQIYNIHWQWQLQQRCVISYSTSVFTVQQYRYSIHNMCMVCHTVVLYIIYLLIIVNYFTLLYIIYILFYNNLRFCIFILYVSYIIHTYLYLYMHYCIISYITYIHTYSCTYILL